LRKMCRQTTPRSGRRGALRHPTALCQSAHHAYPSLILPPARQMSSTFFFN
jgi:hypothetical protein